jgi:rhodanese-related sulfurtransferase
MLGVLAGAALGAGMFINQCRDEPLPLLYRSKAERLQLAVAKVVGAEAVHTAALPVAPLQDISLESFRVFVAEKRGVVLDARPEIFYRLGHVPGALALPRDDFEKSYARLKETLGNHRTQPLMIYCAGGACEDGELVRDALARLGYAHVAIFRGGWTAWKQAGLPDEK